MIGIRFWRKWKQTSRLHKQLSPFFTTSKTFNLSFLFSLFLFSILYLSFTSCLSPFCFFLSLLSNLELTFWKFLSYDLLFSSSFSFLFPVSFFMFLPLFFLFSIHSSFPSTYHSLCFHFFHAIFVSLSILVSSSLSFSFYFFSFFYIHLLHLFSLFLQLASLMHFPLLC